MTANIRSIAKNQTNAHGGLNRCPNQHIRNQNNKWNIAGLTAEEKQMSQQTFPECLAESSL
jgi:hypothetical protein